MNNVEKEPKKSSARRISHRVFVVALIVAVLMIGVAMALSTQIGTASKVVADETTSNKGVQTGSQNRRKLVTSAPNGQIVLLERQTGQERYLTPEEARKLGDGIRNLVSKSTDGLVQIKDEDGSVSMDLQERFQNVMLAKKDADGKVSESCVDNLQAAAEFFEIDPKLLGGDGQKSSSTKKADH